MLLFCYVYSLTVIMFNLLKRLLHLILKPASIRNMLTAAYDVHLSCHVVSSHVVLYLK